MGSGGSNPLKDAAAGVKEAIRDPMGALEDLGNFGLQLGTGGLIGYEGGKIKEGDVTKAAKYGLGELTGANAMREQLRLSQQAINEEARLREEQMQNQRAYDEASDRAASSGARAIRRSSARASGGSKLNWQESVQQDLLGL